MTEFEGTKVVIIFIFFEVFFEVDNGGNVLLTIYYVIIHGKMSPRKSEEDVTLIKFCKS